VRERLLALAQTTHNISVHTPAVNTGALIFAVVAAMGVMWAAKRLKGFFPIIFAVIGAIAVLLIISGNLK